MIFLYRGEEEAEILPHGNKHSYLEEVMEMVSGIHVEKLILGHFSSRYAEEQIIRRVRELCDRYAFNIPVFCILPGKTLIDILQSPPVNN